MIQHSGGCHCGRVAFEVLAPKIITVSRCNCSVCAKSGYLGLIVPRDRFRLLNGEDALLEYKFNTQTAKHTFCNFCGIKSFYTPRSHPQGISVNARCLDARTVEEVRISEFDGQNWERNYPKGRAESFPE